MMKSYGLDLLLHDFMSWDGWRTGQGCLVVIAHCFTVSYCHVHAIYRFRDVILAFTAPFGVVNGVSCPQCARAAHGRANTH